VLNPYALVVLVALLADFCLERAADVLNLKALRLAPPEELADLDDPETTGRPDALISGLEKLTADHLSNLTPHHLHVLLHHSHPPLDRRIDALRELTA